MSSPDLLTKQEAAKLLRCSRKLLQSHISAGRLPVVAMGQSSRSDKIKRSDLEALISNLTITREVGKCLSTSEARKVSTGARSSTTAAELDALLGKPRKEKRRNLNVV